MSEKSKRTEKEFPARLKIHPYIVEKEQSPACPQQATENTSEHLLKFAAVLKNWKKRRKLYWMKFLMYCFFVAYILLSGFPVYLAWAEKWTFREGWSLGGKILLTAAMTSMAVFAIVAGRSSYKKWAERHKC